jgi:hypothetical protein
MKGGLHFRSFTATKNLITLERLLGYEGPVKLSCQDRFGETFAQYVGVRLDAMYTDRFRKRWGRWTVEVEYGDTFYIAAQDITAPLGNGRVKYDFACQLVDGLNECLAWFEANIGDSGSVPECQNPEHGEVSRLVTEAECVPDGPGLWTCIGCGWLVDAEGHKVTRDLLPENSRVPAIKAGQRRSE